MKLETKHLQGYLSHKLRYKWENDVWTMNELHHNPDIGIDGLPLDEIIPILRKLSDFDNHKQEEMFEELGSDDRAEIIEAIEDGNVLYLRFDLIQFLLENHFDIFGLISEGLAVDINSL